MAVSSQSYRNPRTGFYTDLAVDPTPIGSIVPNLKVDNNANSFDHSFTNKNTEPHRHIEAGGNAYSSTSDLDNDPAYTHEGYLYCNGEEYYIKDFPGLYEVIGNEYGGVVSSGIDITAAGSGYSTASTVTISAPPGGGSFNSAITGESLDSVSDGGLTLIAGINADESMIGNHQQGQQGYTNYPNPENKNPSVDWDFNVASLPAGVTVDSYSVLLEDLRAVDGSGDPFIHWSVSGIPNTITNIPADAVLGDITGATINANTWMTA